MNDLRAAAQQALEALESLFSGQFDPERGMRCSNAVLSLKTALEQQEPPPEAQTEAEKIAYCAGWWAAMEAKAKGQPEQEYAGIPGTNVRVRIPTKYRDPSCVGAFNRAKPEHITDGSPCWCDPELNYVDPETGAKVWVHKEPQ